MTRSVLFEDWQISESIQQIALIEKSKSMLYFKLYWAEMHVFQELEL